MEVPSLWEARHIYIMLIALSLTSCTYVHMYTIHAHVHVLVHANHKAGMQGMYRPDHL